MGCKRDEKWMANYEALKAYIDEHHHLPPKNAPLGAKYLLNWCRYYRKKMKAGALDAEKAKELECVLGLRDLDIHTGGRKRKNGVNDAMS